MSHHSTSWKGIRRLAAWIFTRLHPEAAPTRRTTVEAIAAELKYRPDRLPALWYGQRQEVLDYLGYRHITGVQQWSPLAKAKYLRQLADAARRDGGNPDYREIAKKIGSRQDYVRRLLTGLTVFDCVEERDYFELDGVTEQSVDFSLLTTALGYSSIADWVGITEPDVSDSLDDGNLKDLIDWTYRERAGGRTVVGESRNLNSLAKVVTEAAALESLRSGSTLAEAALLTDEPHEIFRQSLHEARDGMSRAIDQSHRVEFDKSDLALLTDVLGLSRNLVTLMRARLEGSDVAE